MSQPVFEAKIKTVSGDLTAMFWSHTVVGDFDRIIYTVQIKEMEDVIIQADSVKNAIDCLKKTIWVLSESKKLRLIEDVCVN